jgi:hypothetical protein
VNEPVQGPAKDSVKEPVQGPGSAPVKGLARRL